MANKGRWGHACEVGGLVLKKDIMIDYYWSELFLVEINKSYLI